MWKMGTRRVGMATFATLAVGLIAAVAAFGVEADKKERWVERYTATAMGTGHSGAAAGRASTVNFIVYRWTTPEERASILELLATNDGKKITKGLEQLEAVGRVQVPGRKGYDLRYAYATEVGGKRQIVLATDRPVASLDAMHSPDVEYLVAIAAFELDPAGKGSGSIAPALELHMTEAGQLEPKSSAADPIKLTNVKKSG